MALSATIGRFDVRAWASSHGGVIGGADNRVMIIDCPFCGKRRHLWVSVVTRRWECYVCGRGAPESILVLIRAVERVGSQDAIAIMEGHREHVSVGSLPSLEPVGVPAVRPSSDAYDPSFLTSLEDFDPRSVPFPEGFRWLGPEGNDYTRSRGIPEGHAPWFRLGETFSGWMRGRLIFPVFYEDRMVYYVGRDMTGNSPKKILNLPSRRLGSCGSRDVLLNLDRAVVAGRGTVVLCEGPISACVMGADAVASFGKRLSKQQIRRMVEQDVRRVVVAWDGDAISEARAVSERLSKIFEEVLIVEFPEDADPADLGHQTSREYVSRAQRVSAPGVVSLPELI